MAGLGVYKLGNGESFPTNCFPTRFHQRKEGAGHWLVAHRVSVEERYKILKQPTPVEHFSSGPLYQSVEQRTFKYSGNTLNRQILMSLHCVDGPSDLCSVDISERNLESVTQEGLEEFDNVAYINASDNILPLEAFSRFPALRELELSLNAVCTVEVNAADFPRLEVKTQIPKVLKVSLTAEALCASEIPSTDTGTKPKNRPQPSDFNCPDILLPSLSQTYTEELEMEKVKTVSCAFHEVPLERENTEISSESQQNEEQFFVTEVNNWLEPEYQDRTEQSADITYFEENDTKQYPKKFLGFEALLDDNLDVDLPEPVGIQQTVKALDFTLKNLFVYRDSKANLDCLQKAYKEQPKRTRNSLPLKPQKTKEEKVNDILTEMKEIKTITEVPLVKVLQAKDVDRNEYEKALMLLKDMKSKYKRIHLKSIEEAAQIARSYR
ncbi:X-ray radiation resistance-associated protein 1 [Bagarius yarrelli]|uniref:X-ray radiation resistance-associated protein 1 n=1 Tax=Bagarius yarrelli TaxID=175774 RepID=A0A556TWW6_BAGYA|nr:X-ray radiation resistance-associated protein 1 [Bagarius yarrelli]